MKTSKTTSLGSLINTTTTRQMACTLALGALQLVTAGSSFAGGFAYEATTLDTTLIFNGIGNDGQPDLWRTNGPNGDTMLIKDINPSGGSNPGNFTKFGNLVIFTARTSGSSKYLMSTDGTEQGTYQLADLSALSSVSVTGTAIVGDELFLSIDTGGQSNDQIWKTDGTEAGTTLFFTSSTYLDSEIRNLTSANETLFFTFEDDLNTIELYSSDGTTEGTGLLKKINPLISSDIFAISAAGNAVFFSADTPQGSNQLWMSDGTEEGTTFVSSVSLAGSDSSRFHYTNGLAFFNARSNSEDNLYVSDGTTAGTRLIRDINPGFGSNPVIVGSSNGTLYFQATQNDPATGADSELWKTDGTEAGTVLVKDINPTGNSNAFDGFTVDETFYFFASDGLTGHDLWTTDGTEQGTFKIYDIAPQQPGLNARFPLAAGGILYYTTSFNAVADVLWLDLNDNDMDGVLNFNDNCSLHSNIDQRDTDNDGFGNRCDPDFNNDGVINFLDVPELTDNFLSTDEDPDLNGDGVVNFLDYSILTDMFLEAPGPGKVTQ